MYTDTQDMFICIHFDFTDGTDKEEDDNETQKVNKTLLRRARGK